MTAPYRAAVDYLYQLQWHGIKLGLDNPRALMQRLGHPEERFRSIHVAGTNGKGSTVAITAAVLAAHGRRVGSYTSPHLIEFTERIRIGHTPIAPESIVTLVERVRAAAERAPQLTPTFFEFTTAMAFLALAEAEVEFGVIEVGMGGRFDATNVLRPQVSVITEIDLDHTAFLGARLAAIAAEKAGIIKPGVPVVTAVTPPEALAVIGATAAERGSRLLRVGHEIEVRGESPRRFDYAGGSHWHDLRCALEGRHQLRNVACALGALEQLSDVTLTEAAVRRGLETVRWEGRLEWIDPPGGPPVLLDGAHNPGGALALADYLGAWRAQTRGRLVLVIGIMKDKDVRAILATLAPLADEVVLTRPDYARAADPNDLAAQLPRGRFSARCFDRVVDALDYCRSQRPQPELVCVTGSLFTVGEARALLVGSAPPSALRG